MAENRNKRSQNKSSPKEYHNWNIPPAMNSSVDQSSEATKSAKISAIDSLFDSGYDSQTVSKTSIDLESDFEQKLMISAANCPELDMTSSTQLKCEQWSDSGLCISSDSGLNISTDLYYKPNEKSRTQSGPHFKSIVLLREAYEPDQDGDTYLHLSIIKGLQDVSYALIYIVPHPDFLDIFNHLLQSPLHLAALTRQPNIVRRLIISGATVDLRDRHGNTALHIACAQSDQESVIRILAPISEKEMNEAKVVNYCVSAHHLPNEFLELKNYEGETCLHLAAYNKDKNIIEYLVKSGVNINAKEGKSGKSILHLSVENKNLDLVQFLVSRCKADVNVRSYAGHTPLYIAWMLDWIQTNSRIREIIKYLRKFGAEPSQQPDFDELDDSDSSKLEEILMSPLM